MSSTRPALTDLASQLGLRGPYSKKREDWAASSSVRELWHKLTELCRIHHTKTMYEISDCQEVQEAQEALMAEYGPRIWTTEQRRTWLLNPGEGAPAAPYEKDLYWRSDIDQKFIKDTFRTLVTEKIARWRKDNIRKSRAASENRSDPSYSPMPTNTSGRLHPKQTMLELRCFSADPDNHLDASLLRQSVWLGDWNEEKLTVNGPSWKEIEKNYYESTTGGSQCHNAEPFAFDEVPKTQVVNVQCAACKTAAPQSCEVLTLELYDFHWLDDEDKETEMKKNIWTFKSSLHGRDVVAFVKELPEREWRKMGSETPLWSFWKLNGGYTTNFLLVTTAEDTTTPILQSDIVLFGPDKGKRKREVSPSRPKSLLEEPAHAKRSRTTAETENHGTSRKATRVRGDSVYYYQCPNCDYSSGNKASVDRHLERAKKTAQVDQGREECGACGQFFCNSRTLRYHHCADERSSPSRSKAKITSAAVEKSGFTAVSRPAVEPTPPDPALAKATEHRDTSPSFDSMYDVTPSPESSVRRLRLGSSIENAAAAGFFGHFVRTNSNKQQSAEQCAADLKQSTALDSEANLATTATAATVPISATGTAPATGPLTAIPFASPYGPTQSFESRNASEPRVVSTSELTEAKAQPQLSERSDTMEPPQFTMRFRIWFRIPLAGGHKVVILDDSMSIEGVFTRVRQSLRRQLEGKTLLALHLRTLADDEDSIIVDEDDSDAWETVLALAREQQRAELLGTLEVQ